MKRHVVVSLFAAVLTACAAAPTTSDPATPVGGAPSDHAAASPIPETVAPVPSDAVPVPSGTVRLLFAGDVMLGRRVAPVAAAEGPEFMEAVRHVVSSADFAAANLESPLTDRPHISDNPNELETSPEMASLLAGAGFDVMSVANNHATDAGTTGLLDTLAALDEAGVAPLGAGATAATAVAPFVGEHDGIAVAFLAFDATRLATPAVGDRPGVATYDRETARIAIEGAARLSDVLVVSLHGGVEYLLETDPVIEDLAGELVAWGADVVWGHGAHVPQPVTVAAAPGGRSAVVATSLGNFVFDQQRPATQTGLLLEVVVSVDGVIAFRVGRVVHPDLRPVFETWDLPVGSAAALLDGEWWSLVSPQDIDAAEAIDVPGFTMGDVTTAAIGDATGDGEAEYAVSYRHTFRSNPVNRLYPDRDWTDAEGRSAHFGLFDPDTLEPIWAAGTLLRPIAEIEVCDGAVALSFDSLDGHQIEATGAWRWWDFGFVMPDELPGGGRPMCVDIDRDGRDDPVIAGR